MSQTHGNSEKTRIRNFKPTVLKVYLEFANETGTVGKLCVSTFTLYNPLCVSNKVSVRNSKKTTEVQLEECKITGADQFSEQQLRCGMAPKSKIVENLKNFFFGHV